MVYREPDELAERRADAREKLRTLAAKGASTKVADRAALPFRVVDTGQSFLDGQVVGRLVIRVGMRMPSHEDFELMRGVVARLWPSAELARGDGVIAVFALASADADENHGRLWALLGEALPALHRLQPVTFVTILKQAEPARAPASSPPKRVGGPGDDMFAHKPQPEKLVAWLIPTTGEAAGTTIALREGSNVLEAGLRIDVSGRTATLHGPEAIVLGDSDRFAWDGVEYVYKAMVIEAG